MATALTPEQKKFVEDNLNLARFIAGKMYQKYRITEIPYEDAIQIAYWKLCLTAQRFNPTKASLSAYLTQSIVRAFMLEIRRSCLISITDNRRSKNEIIPHVVSYSQPAQGYRTGRGQDTNENSSLLELICGVKDIDSAIDIESAIENLPERERMITKKIIAEFPRCAIAMDLGVSRVRVNQILTRVQAKIRNVIEDKEMTPSMRRLLLNGKMKAWRRRYGLRVIDAAQIVYCRDKDWSAWEKGEPISDWWRERIEKVVNSPPKKNA